MRFPGKREDKPMEQATILVVEDESIVATDLRERLTGMGYSVPAVAASGAEGLQIAERIHPDLMLMDIRLKGQMDGIETAEQVRDVLGVGTVYLTAYDDEETLRRAKLTQPFGYVLKPFDDRTLRCTLEMALYRQRMENRLRETERWLMATLRCVAEAVIVMDQTRHIRFMNAAAEALTGWKQQQALGQDITDILAVARSAENPVTAACRNGQTVSLKGHHLAVAGTEIQIDGTAAPVVDDNHALKGVVLAFQAVNSSASW
jgi:PAS domain S-box-containing protein